MLDGLFLIDKEPDCTSHDVVQQIRRITRQKKIGHCGTLDPGATGLLVATAGKATRLTRFLIRAPKVYSGVIHFGVSTDTYDRHGAVVEEGSIEHLTLDRVQEGMQKLVGTYDQTAPPYSAKKHQGVKYYELARRGEEVPAAAKKITVSEFEPEGNLEQGSLAFRLSCSSGTYVRSLAHDLGTDLGCGAHLAELRRLQVGPFSVEDAVTLGELQEAAAADGALRAGWVPLDDIPLPFSQVLADAQQEKRIVHGQSVLFRTLEAEAGDWVKLVDRRNRLIGVGIVQERIGTGTVGVVQPRIVFN